MSSSIGFVNTQAFREAAIYWEKHRRYDDGTPGTIYHKDYWNREIDRCINGYETGGIRISGYHYHYLNYTRIEVTERTYGQVHKNAPKNAKTHADRKELFPDFWDVDWAYFTCVDIAEFGIDGVNDLGKKLSLSWDQYKNSPISLNINETSLSGGHHIVWLKPRGVGAPQPHSEIVLTPNGETTIGEIQIGDFVFDRQGRATKVIDKYPQGLKEVWEVELLDGRIVECGNNHIWSLEYHNRGLKQMTTEQMFNSGLTWSHSTGQKTYKYKLPKIEPVKYEKKELPIHPYILGALLGGGDTYSKSVRIANDDIELIDKFKKILGHDYELVKDNTNNNYLIKYLDNHNKQVKEQYSISPTADKGRVNPLKRELHKLGLRVKCQNKFIPEIYKRGSVQQRAELVKGLMDTDGSISEKGYCEFCNTSLKLIEDLAYIIRSLGLYCSYSFCDRKRTQSITDRSNKTSTFEEKGYWRLFIATNKNIFYISRKAERINTTKKTKFEIPIVDIRRTGRFEEQSCLSVENDEHLYLTRNFVPTHNSWKAASMAERNYACIRGSKTYMLANDKTFLTEDGLWSKYMAMRDWQIGNAAGLGKSSDYKKDRSNMHFEASREVNGQKVGFKSEVIGVTLNNDWQKARGKRGKLVLWEELGKFPNADKAWRVARRSVEEGNKIYGLMLGFGTGGTKDANFEALKTMFYDPLAYNILCFDNVYGENKTDFKVVGMFTPATMSIAFKDENGNSDQAASKEYLDGERDIAREAKDQTTLPAIKAEDPYTPEEAVLVTGKNIFISEGLIQHAKRVEIQGLYKSMPTPGRFERSGLELKFKIDLQEGNKATYKFPHNLNSSTEGSILIYHSPYKREGIIPSNLYKICVDTYEHDTTTGDSLGAIYVIEQLNNFTSTRGDVIAASFIGRPDTQEEFNKVLFELAEYYHAEVAYENDKPGDVVGYAKRHKKLQYLAEEFELAFDETLKSAQGSKRQFGVSMNGGKEDKRRKQGDIFTKNWLYTIRSVSAEGNIIYNYHTVYDLGLLQEWLDYSIDDNRDRNSAFRVGMYHQQELLYNEIAPQMRTQKTQLSEFFARPLF